MAIGYLNVAIIGRSSGRSAVAAAAYASRTDLVDERTGTAYRYARKSGDIVQSFIWLPKDAPERLRERATLWNEVERAENRKNSQTARRIIIGLPHELTQKQQELLLKDFVRENFTRKGLAVDASIHEPDVAGDERNHHAHLLVPTRFIDRNGLGKKDRENNSQELGLEAWKKAWVLLANRHLQRHGHGARISFEVKEGQTPQNHMGPEATALERKGIETRAGDDRLEIITDNMRPAGNDNVPVPELRKAFDYAAGKDFARDVVMPPMKVQQPQDWAAGKAFAREVIAPANDNKRPPAPQTVDRDAEHAEWQDAVDKAAIAHEEAERRKAFLQSQADARAAFERRGQAMTERHAVSWGEMLQRHQTEMRAILAAAPAGYQPGTIAEAEQAVSGGVAFVLDMFTSLAEGLTRSMTSRGKAQPKRPRGPDKAKLQETQRQAEQQREAHSRELEAMLQEQARERAAYEQRRALMLFQQAGALQNFEEQVSDKSSLRDAFEKQTERVEGYRAYKEEQGRRAPGRKGRDGPELD